MKMWLRVDLGMPHVPINSFIRLEIPKMHFTYKGGVIFGHKHQGRKFLSPVFWGYVQAWHTLVWLGILSSY